MSETEMQGPKNRRITSLEDLIHYIELTDVVTLRVSGERNEDRDNGVSSDSADAKSQPFSVYHRADDTEIEVRCVLAISTPEARFLSDIAAIYAFSEPLEVDNDILTEFTQMVGVMTVYPYLRESIQSTASRMRVSAPVLGLLKQGGFEVTSEPAGAHPLDTPTSGRDDAEA